MNIEDEPLKQEEDVVVIEERDKHTILYIAIAAILGMAIGGLAGSIATKSKWESAYQSLEVQLENIENEKIEVVKEQVIKVEKQQANIEDEVNARIASKLEELTNDYKTQLETSKTLVTELEKLNIELEEQVQDQAKTIQDNTKQLSVLNRQTDMQATIFERSRELFQREFSIKQKLADLQDEREDLTPRLERYKKECDVYLEGKSWDASSQSCDKHDEVNSNISQIDQMIEVHKLDLREIKQISEQLGL